LHLISFQPKNLSIDKELKGGTKYEKIARNNGGYGLHGYSTQLYRAESGRRGPMTGK